MKPVAFAALAVLLLGSACTGPEPERPLLPKPSDEEVARIQALATAACKCARRPGANRSRCWSVFDKAVAAYRDSGRSDSACGFVSSSVRHFNGEVMTSDSFAIVDGWHLSTKAPQLCTAEEASVVAAIIEKTNEGRSTIDLEPGIAAARLLAAGGQVASPGKAEGCAA